jgi:hypothetical protein
MMINATKLPSSVYSHSILLNCSNRLNCAQMQPNICMHMEKLNTTKLFFYK